MALQCSAKLLASAGLEPPTIIFHLVSIFLLLLFVLVQFFFLVLILLLYLCNRNYDTGLSNAAVMHDAG